MRGLPAGKIVIKLPLLTREKRQVESGLVDGRVTRKLDGDLVGAAFEFGRQYFATKSAQ